MKIPFFSDSKPKKVGIALSGGAARGIAHIGVFKRLKELGINVHCMAGTSSGSLVGGLIATGIDMDQMIKRVKKLRWLDIAGFTLSRTGMVSSKKLEKYMSRIIGKVHFSDLKIPFTALATDILTGDPVELNQPDLLLATAVRASSSFPGVYPPVELYGRYLIDGGASTNIPVQTVRNMGADFVIAVDVIPDIKIDKLPKNLALMVDRGLDLLLRRHRLGLDADIILQPMVEHVSSFDMRNPEKLIQMGIDSVDANIHSIKKQILDA